MFSGAGTLSYTPDMDLIFKCALFSTVASITVIGTTNPTLTAANLSAPSATKIENDVIFATNPSGRNQQVVSVPILKDRTIFVTSTGITSCVCHFDTPETDTLFSSLPVT
jgi:hypothetical protein